MDTLIQASTIPATGDNMGWLIWLIIAILVIAVITIVVSYFVRKNKATKSKSDKTGTHAKHK